MNINEHSRQVSMDESKEIQRKRVLTGKNQKYSMDERKERVKNLQKER